ncbi:hypothetical protein TUM15798_19760 [Neisseria gonorrhoeae]|nr:hypothetical protein TUM15798_19760 [Neisseria gonorrhoeae]
MTHTVHLHLEETDNPTEYGNQSADNGIFAECCEAVGSELFGGKIGMVFIYFEKG